MTFNYSYIILMLLIANYTTAQKSSDNLFFELNGVVNTSSSNKLFISYFDDQNNKIIDSTIVANGSFKFRGLIKEPRESYLSTNNIFRMDGYSTIKFYLSPNIIKVKTSFNNLSNSEFKGSETQREFLELKKMKSRVFFKQDSLFALRVSFVELINKTQNVDDQKILKEKVGIIDDAVDSSIDEEIIKEFEFIKEYPYSYVCTDLLLSRLKGRKSSKYFSQIQDLYNSLSSKLKNSMRGILLKEKLVLFSENNVGKKIKDYTLIDINKSQFKLSELTNGKYVLLDFWASWCGPCRADTPYLKKLHQKYNNKGFEIVGLSKDQDRKSWIDAIKKDQADWRHILLKDNDNTIEESFFITSIPVKILIDPDGFIIGRWRGGGKDNEDDIVNKITRIFANN